MALESIVERAAGILGYSTLKHEQKDAIMKFLGGNDVFVSLPTGYGKSLCYAALPWAFDILLKRDSSNMSKRSIVIVISPLLALIQDQLASLSVKGLDVGCITGDSTEEQRSRVQQGCCQIVFFSPESLLSGSHWRKMLHNELYYDHTVAFTIDEAHCVKKW